MRRLASAAATLLLLTSAAWADGPRPPQGYGERLFPLGPGWVSTPLEQPEQPEQPEQDLELKRVEEAQAELEAGAWLLVPCSTFQEFLLSGDGEAVDVYLLRDAGLSTGPATGQPRSPTGRALLGVRLERRPAGDSPDDGWRISIGLRASKGWVGLRAREAADVRLVGLRLEVVPESWERWEREARAASDPADPWPSVPWLAHQTLPGHDLDAFFAKQQALLPWTPEEDDAAARSVRIGGQLLSAFEARPLLRAHVHQVPWSLPEGPRFEDGWGSSSGRAYALSSEPLQREVEGPAILRVWVRGTWSHGDTATTHAVRLRIKVGQRQFTRELLPQVDLAATTALREDTSTVEELAALDLHRVLLSSAQQVRVAIPAGQHRVEVAAISSNTWLTVEVARRIEQLEQKTPLAYLDVSAGDDPRGLALKAAIQELRGESAAALQTLVELLQAEDSRPRLWAATHLLALGRTLGRNGVLTRARAIVEQALAAADERAEARAEESEDARSVEEGRAARDLRLRLLPSAREALLEDALLTGRTQAAAQLAHAVLALTKPTQRALGLVHRALARSGEVAGKRLFAVPTLAGEGRALRRLLLGLGRYRRESGRFLRLPRLDGRSQPKRLLVPIVASMDGPEASPEVTWDWQAALGLSGHAALLVGPPGTRLLASGVQPIELQAADPRRPSRWALVSGEGRIAPGDLPPWRPMRLELPPGEVALVGEEGTGLALVRGGVRPVEYGHARWGRQLDLEPLTPERADGAPGAATASVGSSTIAFRLSPSPWPGVARLRVGVKLREGVRQVDLPLRLSVEGRAEPFDLRLLLLQETTGPGGPWSFVGNTTLVVPAGPARLTLSVAGRAPPVFAALEEQVYVRVALDPSRRAPRRVSPLRLLELLDRPADLARLPELKQLSLKLASAPAVEKIALLEARARLLVSLDDVRAAERDLRAGLELLPTIAQLGARRDARLRLNLGLALLAWETGEQLRLRFHVRELVTLEGTATEIDLLEAALALRQGRPVLARSRLERVARRRGRGPPTPLEQVVAAGLGVELGQRVRSPYLAALRDLHLLAHRGSLLTTEALAARLAQLQRRLEELVRTLEADGRRFRALRIVARLEAIREARARLARGEAVLDTGGLDPLSSQARIDSDSIRTVSRRVLLDGGDGSWPAYLLGRGESVEFEVNGPDLLSLEWRSAHMASAGGAPRRHAAPARYIVEGLPAGPRSRVILRSRPSREVGLARGVISLVRPEDPDAAGSRLVPGNADRYRVSVPPGRHTIKLSCTAGQGFLVLRREAGRWLVTAPKSPRRPKAVAVHPLAPRLGVALGEDVERRLNTLIHDPSLALGERAWALADDLLFLVATRDDPDPASFVAALAIQRSAGPASADLEHVRRHDRLARGLARRRSVDLSTQLPTYRRLELLGGLESEARSVIFEPFAGPGSRLIGERERRAWQLRPRTTQDVTLELVAALPREVDESGSVTVRVFVEGKLELEQQVPLGEHVRLQVARGLGHARVEVELSAGQADSGLLGRVRLLVAPAGAPAATATPTLQSSLVRVHPAHGGSLTLPVQGPAALELEHWPASGLKRAGLKRWVPLLPPRRIGIRHLGRDRPAPVTLPRSGFVRLVSSDLDLAGHARLRGFLREVVPRSHLRDASAGPGDQATAWELPAEAPSPLAQPQAWKNGLVLEPYTIGIVRNNEERRFLDEEVGRSELRAGLRLHHRYRDWPLYTRLQVGVIKPEGQASVLHGEVRTHLYLTRSPQLSLRFRGSYYRQRSRSGGNYGLDGDLRLRLRSSLPAGFQLLLDAHLRGWDTSVSRRRARRQTGDLYRLIFNQYRLDHRQWVEGWVRGRWYPYQNLWGELFAGVRSNQGLSPLDADRVLYGARLSYHWEWAFLEAGYRGVHRFSDKDRRSSNSEDFFWGELGFEGWVTSWLRASIRAGARFQPQVSATTATFGISLWLGREGARSRAIDSELIPFPRYQDAVTPWPERAPEEQE